MRKWLSLLVVLALTVSMAAVSVSADSTLDFTLVLKSERVTEADMAAVEAAGGTVMTRLDNIGVLQVRTSRPAQFLKAMQQHRDLAEIGPSLPLVHELPATEEPANVGASPADPSDPMDYLWGMDRVTGGGAAWAIHTGTKDVVVGVIDSGIDFGHPDLMANIVPGSRTFVPGTVDANDENGHGSHVAGTIAANGRIRGVAPDVGIRAYRVFGATGGAYQIWITDAIMAATDDGVDVINMSLGGFRVRGQWYYVDPGTGERIRLGNDTADMVAYKRAIDYAVKRGVTVVAAAGNDAQDISKRHNLTEWYQSYLHDLGYTMYEVQGATFEVPGGVPGVITVSAMGGGFGTDDRLTFYSNYGAGSIELTAPGGDRGPTGQPLDSDYWKYYIVSTVPHWMPCNLSNVLFGECGYGFYAGTSMASPHVAGTAALYISHQYALTGQKPSPAQVAAHLQQTAADLGKPGYDRFFGHGMVDAYRALGGQ